MTPARTDRGEKDLADSPQAEPVGEPAADLLEEAEALRSAAGRFVRAVLHSSEGLPRGQAAVLGFLVRDGELAIADLAARQKVRHQSMARTVKLLAEQDLVQLNPDTTDRRRVLVRLTDLGLTRLEQERRNRSVSIATALSALPATDRRTLAELPDLLDTLTEHLRY